jgi:hypothetical protein
MSNKKFYCAMCALALLFSFNFVSTVPATEKASSKSTERTTSMHPWASFNPTSWVEIKSTSVNTNTAGKEETNIIGTKITLLKKTIDKVFLENEMTVKGQTTKTKFDLPLKGYSDDHPEGMKILNTGSETITIAGKSVTCDTMEASMNAGETKIHFKRWTSRQVPGALVKMVTSSDGSKSTAEVVDFKVY